MLLDKQDSCIILIDVQSKLTPFIKDSEKLIKNCQRLLNLANDMHAPHIIMEQYPVGLGSTVQPLKHFSKALPKVHFSCWRDNGCQELLLNLNKKQIILIGIESHVCVLQTALDLIVNNYEVFVVVDAISSRNIVDQKYALKRMQQFGVQLITLEMVFFEWIKQAGTVEFKLLSKAFFANTSND